MTVSLCFTAVGFTANLTLIIKHIFSSQTALKKPNFVIPLFLPDEL